MKLQLSLSIPLIKKKNLYINPNATLDQITIVILLGFFLKVKV